MSCEEIEPALISFHFGLVHEPLRRQIEEHLPGCPTCLRAFLDLKRHIETAESGPQPSAALRERVRASVARELGLPAPRRWSWWERPLAFSAAALGVVVAMLAVGELTKGPPGASQGLRARPVVTAPGP